MPRNTNLGTSTLRNRNRVTNKTRLKIIQGSIDADLLVVDEDEEKARIIITAGVDAEDADGLSPACQFLRSGINKKYPITITIPQPALRSSFVAFFHHMRACAIKGAPALPFFSYTILMRSQDDLILKPILCELFYIEKALEAIARDIQTKSKALAGLREGSR
ncbi:hypothetical protein EDD22DRAFT_1009819 [Suillus occidentalis]|nr:hypothetical protein EDD22DRAFT_1009819 [Suillus occidentalis]